MNSVAAAAFDTTFWFHHCNVDRLYQKYLTLNPGAKADARELARSEHEQDPSSPNLFLTPFVPFKHPKTGKPFMPEDAFGLEGLGYVYDKLVPDPEDNSQELNQMPSFAVFNHINIRDLNLETYQLHVFLVDGDKLSVPPIETDPDDFHQFPNYAGMGSIFGGKEDCSNCATRVPFSVRVNITPTLNRLDVSRYSVTLGVIAVDHSGVSHPLSATPVPLPDIQGPLFEDAKENLSTGCEKTARAVGEVKSLQKYLSSYGFYNGAVDGVFGETTEEAVKKFQASAGMPPNGVVCKTTKKWMVAPRFDTKKQAQADVTPRARGTNLTYWVGVSPAGLDREHLLAEIQRACNVWAEATGCSWTRIDSWTDCDVEILWHDVHYHATLLKKSVEDVKVSREEIEKESQFDGPGGQLAHSGWDFLHLDITEKWLTLDQTRTSNTQFRVYNVVLHELGHVLGLDHSTHPQDLMSPFYDDEHVKLTSSDDQTVRALYP
jgi:peptidoglycan hydrolase-like protein with peptidoglycan-binding domain